MLLSLGIRDFLLIDRLDLDFEDGLCVLTGETGAGKSILLDALVLALGGRSSGDLVRKGAKQATITAVFSTQASGIADTHPAQQRLAEQGFSFDDGEIVLRRLLSSEGRSRAFINDQPASIGLLRALSADLIELQGQFENHSLFDVGRHRALLDAHGKLSSAVESTGKAWKQWRLAQTDFRDAEAALEASQREEAYLRHEQAELEALDLQEGELERLEEQRELLRHREKLVTSVSDALMDLEGEGARSDSASVLVERARRALERSAAQSGGHFVEPLDALDRAAAEILEAVALLQSFLGDMEFEEGRLEKVEDRFFSIRDLARKFGVEPQDLLGRHEEVSRKLSEVEDGAARLAELKRECDAARLAFLTRAEALSRERRVAATGLDRAINEELPALKLEKATFHTRIDTLEEASWASHGTDKVEFLVSTNSGAPLAPMNRVASGGELSRFLLALKVALAEVEAPRTLVFDEVDSGIGGATAHAVGERLSRLAEGRQVVVVTHSPQVAARSSHHWQVRKEEVDGGSVTRVASLGPEARKEEIARMLSGAEVTDEARAAAERLMG